MPRETIEILLSQLAPYQSGAHFVAVVTYPDPLDRHKRDQYHQAIVRWAIERRMYLDPEWAKTLQPIRPAWFSGSDALHDAILKRGNKRLRERMAAAQFILLPHLRAVDTGRPQTVNGFVPTVNNMAILAGDLLGLGSGSQATVKSRIWKPTKPVAHAMCAYIVWHQTLWEKWGRNPSADKQLAFLLLPEMVEEVVELSEIFRVQLREIDQFIIHEHETIQFTTSWLPDDTA